MLEVEKYISDGKILNLIEAYLKQDIVNGLEQWTPTAGAPQGAIISLLLANLYLHELDKTMMQADYTMVRYADDFVILCDSQGKAEQALVIIQQWVNNKELILHPDKKHIGNCMIKGQGFEFLGYRFEAGKRFVKSKSLKALKDKIHRKTKRGRGDSMECIIKDLNPMLRGWFNYFKHADKWIFPNLDGFIRRRLRSLRCQQMKGDSNFGRTRWLHKQMPNTYFSKQGLFSLKEAHVMACQSRCGNS